MDNLKILLIVIVIAFVIAKIVGYYHNSNEKTESSSEDMNNYIQSFEMFVVKILNINGFDNLGNYFGKIKEPTKDDLKWIENTIDIEENPFMEKIILEEWEKKKKINTNLTPLEFAKDFVKYYHNTQVEKFAPPYVQERNKELMKAYKNILITIKKIQGWLDKDTLRTRIESELRKREYIKATIYQCTTPWCVVSIGCDGLGRYNIVYSLDHRVKEMIGGIFASTFIRRIYEVTPGKMEPFVNIGYLFEDCILEYENLIEESKTESFHKIITENKHILDANLN